jgi:glycosyltransferase involved in cell wall biosynthesis
VSDTADFAGAELYASTLVETLRGRCGFVAIVGDEAADETGRRLTDAGAELRIVRGLRRYPSIGAVLRLAKTLRAVDPALVHVNLSDQGDGLTALAAGWLARRPLVATLHLVIPGRSRWREAVSARALRTFRAVIGVSNSVGAYVEQRGGRARVVLNGLLPPAPVLDARDALGIAAPGLVVGGVGRLHEQKGWDVLCRAAPIVRRELPDTVFAVIGRGPEEARLGSMPECSDVRFLGYREHAASLLGAFDILAVPSRYEGLGLTPLEALFQGVPVVASNVEGLAEVLGDCAVLVPHDDPQALASGILRLASDADLRADLAERGRRRAEELFSAERMAEETLAVYRAVAVSPARPVATVHGMRPPGSGQVERR